MIFLLVMLLALTTQAYKPVEFYRRFSNYIQPSSVKNDKALGKQSYSQFLWEVIKHEAKIMSTEDIRSSTLLANMIVVPNSLEEAIIDTISLQMECPLFTAAQLRNIFIEVLEKNESISTAWSLDLLATAIQDPSMPTTASALLFNKGYHALASYRIAHTLWYTGRDSLARYFQSLISRTFDSDIHPACQIGPSCYFPSGSGIVLGETGSVGRDCSFSHGVTLGGTGKESGDRHPKVGNSVFFGTGATVLGNIFVGDGSIVNAGSVVTKPVAPLTRVGGVPAKFIANVNTKSCDVKENTFINEEKVCLDSPMSFEEFCERYLFDIAKLRDVAHSLPPQA
jgi:serine O-acetyltransferase